MRQRDVAALDAKNTEEVADAKAENDALRDDVAALVRRQFAHQQSVNQCVTTLPRLRRGLYSLPDWQTPLNGIISPQAQSLCKNNWKNPEVY